MATDYSKIPISAANLKAIKPYVLFNSDGQSATISSDITSAGISENTSVNYLKIEYPQKVPYISDITVSTSGWVRCALNGASDATKNEYFYLCGGRKIGNNCYYQQIGGGYYAEVTTFYTISPWTATSTEKSSHTFYGSIKIPASFAVGEVTFDHILNNNIISFAKSLDSSSSQSYLTGNVYRIENSTDSSQWTCHYGCYDPALTTSITTTSTYYVVLKTYYYSLSVDDF